MRLKKSIILFGLYDYRQNAIDLLVLGLHNSGSIIAEGTRADSIMAFNDGTFARVCKDDLIDRINAGSIIDCYSDREKFFETVKEQIIQ